MTPTPPDALQRASLAEELRRGGATTLLEALRFVQQMPEGEDRSTYLQALLRLGMQVDPEATLNVVLAWGDGKLREHAATFALGQWGERDAPAALQWAAMHPRVEDDSTWFCAAYEGFAATKPMEALQFLQRSELAAEVDALSRIVVFHFSESNRLPDARSAIEQLPAGRVRDLLALQLVQRWAPQDPLEAAKWLASNTGDAAFRDGMATLVHALAATQPTFAAGVARQFPDGRRGRDLLGDVVYLWAQRDLGSAANWVRAQPTGPAMDGAIVRLIEAVGPNDPNEARSLSGSLTSPELREQMYRRWAPR